MVCLESGGANAFALEFFYQSMRLIGGGRISDDDVGAVIRQFFSDRCANAARAASYEGDFIFEWFGHGNAPVGLTLK